MPFFIFRTAHHERSCGNPAERIIHPLDRQRLTFARFPRARILPWRWIDVGNDLGRRILVNVPINGVRVEREEKEHGSENDIHEGVSSECFPRESVLEHWRSAYSETLPTGFKGACGTSRRLSRERAGVRRRRRARWVRRWRGKRSGSRRLYLSNFRRDRRDYALAQVPWDWSFCI